MTKSRKLTYLMFAVLFLIQLGSHAPVLFQDLRGFHVWRQTQTQNTINSFVEEDFNILNPRRNERGAGDGIFRMEFPLMQWITAIPVKLFGHSVFVSRLMNFLFAFFGFIGFFKLISLFFHDKRIRILLGIAFWFSPLMYYYMVNPMPDNLALAFGIWSLYFLQVSIRSGKISHEILSVCFLALASLVKLPYILYYVPFAWAMLFLRNTDSRLLDHARLKPILRSAGLAMLSLVPVVEWYGWVISSWEGNGIVQGIFNMTPEQKAEFWYYTGFHFRSTLPELILGWPLLILFLTGLWISIAKFKRGFKNFGHFFILIIALGSFIMFEMNMLGKVHDYYFMPLIPVVFLIVGVGLKQFFTKLPEKKWLAIIATVMVLALPVYSFFRVDSRWDRTGFNEDLLTYKTELREAVPDNALVCVGNDVSHHIFLYYVDKKGWGFENNWISHKELSKMIEQGCRYLYCDSRVIDQNPKIKRLFGTKVAEFGSVKIFKLVLPNELSGL